MLILKTENFRTRTFRRSDVKTGAIGSGAEVDSIPHLVYACKARRWSMLLNDDEIKSRLESPDNLLNRLRSVTKNSTTGMEIFKSSEPQPPSNAFTYFTGDGFDFGKNESPAVFDPSTIETDKIDELVEDSAKKIKLGIVKTRALDVLHDSLGELGNRLGEVSKVRDLATIAKVANDILTADDSKKNNIGQQVIVYKPIVNDISKYETLIVQE